MRLKTASLVPHRPSPASYNSFRSFKGKKLDFKSDESLEYILELVELPSLGWWSGQWVDSRSSTRPGISWSSQTRRLWPRPPFLYRTYAYTSPWAPASLDYSCCILCQSEKTRRCQNPLQLSWSLWPRTRPAWVGRHAALCGSYRSSLTRHARSALYRMLSCRMWLLSLVAISAECK